MPSHLSEDMICEVDGFPIGERVPRREDRNRALRRGGRLIRRSGKIASVE